tara:strand:+ start:2257 stop:2886 length:630 start_codon:yes stop_codon:yes gene_type:complete
LYLTYFIFGFLIGSSLILAIGPQNIFVVEQGLKKQFTFLVCLICSVSDLILIFFGLFIFSYLSVYFTKTVNLILNLALIIFLINFIWNKINQHYQKISLNLIRNNETRKSILVKTLGFTYLNPHVYSDTVFFIGNLSKDLSLEEKLFFGMGASLSSFIFFFLLGYLSKLYSNYLANSKILKKINIIIIMIMLFLLINIILSTIKSFFSI